MMKSENVKRLCTPLFDILSHSRVIYFFSLNRKFLKFNKIKLNTQTLLLYIYSLLLNINVYTYLTKLPLAIHYKKKKKH